MSLSLSPSLFLSLSLILASIIMKASHERTSDIIPGLGKKLDLWIGHNRGLVLDGDLETNAHVYSEVGNLTCFRPKCLERQ